MAVQHQFWRGGELCMKTGFFTRISNLLPIVKSLLNRHWKGFGSYACKKMQNRTKGKSQKPQ